jgi:hypothetical protein
VLDNKKYLQHLQSKLVECDFQSRIMFPRINGAGEVWAEGRKLWFSFQVIWRADICDAGSKTQQCTIKCDPYVMRVMKHSNSLHDEEAEGVRNVVSFLEAL